MEQETNISGISENLAESIVEQKAIEKKQILKSVLQGKKIAISVSNSEELEQLGLSENHIKDISIELARYLIVNGATMLYGGDLRDGGFTELFSELSYQYKFLNDKENRFVNYFPFPNSKKVTLNDRANFVKKQVEARIIEIPKHLGKIDMEKKYEPFQNVEDRFVYSECFADMRIIMANESHARILLGGKQKNFLGYIPGIIEEAYQSLKADKPLYLLGGFGGATKSIIQVISGERPKELTNEFQFDSDFQNRFKGYCINKSIINIDYNYLVSFFQKHTIGSISKKNGLSIEENQILFTSTNIHEVVFLILKGLQFISQ